MFDSCEETDLRMITYRVNAPKLNCRDIISKMNEVGANCPIFVFVNIAKLPIVTADVFSIAKITKDFSSILNIEQHVMNPVTTLADLQNDVRAAVDKCTAIDTISGDIDALKSVVNRCFVRRRIESNSSTPESISPSSTHSLSTGDDDGDHDVDDNNDEDDDNDDDDEMMTTMMLTMIMILMKCLMLMAVMIPVLFPHPMLLRMLLSAHTTDKKILMVLCTLFIHIHIIPTRQKIHLI